MMIKINENMSVLYMAYQLLLFASSLLTPGTIFLLIVGAINTAFQQIDLMEALFINLAPVILFLAVCLTSRSRIQVMMMIMDYLGQFCMLVASHARNRVWWCIVKALALMLCMNSVGSVIC